MEHNYEELTPSLRGFPIGNYIVFYRPTDRGITIERILSGYRDLDTLFQNEDENSFDSEAGSSYR